MHRHFRASGEIKAEVVPLELNASPAIVKRRVIPFGLREPVRRALIQVVERGPLTASTSSCYSEAVPQWSRNLFRIKSTSPNGRIVVPRFRLLTLWEIKLTFPSLATTPFFGPPPAKTILPVMPSSCGFTVKDSANCLTNSAVMFHPAYGTIILIL